MKNLNRILAIFMILLMLFITVSCGEETSKATTDHGTSPSESTAPSVSIQPSVEVSPNPTLDLVSKLPPETIPWDQ